MRGKKGKVDGQKCRICEYCYCTDDENLYFCLKRKNLRQKNTIVNSNRCPHFVKGTIDVKYDKSRRFGGLEKLLEEEREENKEKTKEETTKRIFPPIEEGNEENCKLLIGAMYENWFHDLKRIIKRKSWCNFRIIDEVCNQTYYIITHPWCHFIMEYPVKICSKFLEEVAPIKKGKHTYKITDTRTGVHFTAHMNYHYPDYYILKSKPYIKIERVEE